MQNSGDGSFQRCAVVLAKAELENHMRCVMTRGQEILRQEDDWVDRVGWMVKSSQRYLGLESGVDNYLQMQAVIFREDTHRNGVPTPFSRICSLAH